MSAEQPLPLDRRWYRELLVVVAFVGLAVSLLGMVYLGATGAAADLVFGDPRVAAWSGEWWWILVTALGGVAVAALRGRWHAQAPVPGGVAVIESGAVDPRVAPTWVAFAAVSAVAGASLGPSFALIIIGGGLASWISSHRWPGNQDARLEATMAGIAGSLGGAFTSPLLGTVMVTELAPTKRSKYLESVVLQLIAATFGFGLFFAVVGTTFLDSFEIPVEDFAPSQLVIGVVLGAASSVLMLTFTIIVKVVNRGAGMLTNPYLRGLVGGSLVGLIAVALPLTVGAGNAQLSAVIDDAAVVSIGLLVAVLIGKMVAMALSLAAGFVGGSVLPMLFVGGTAGVIAHQLFPSIPYAVAVGCMMSAVPGATVRAPIGLTLIAGLAIGFGPVTVAPVAVAVVTAHVMTASIVTLIRDRMSVPTIHA